MKRLFSAYLFVFIIFGSCKPKENPKSSVVIDLKHIFGNKDLFIGGTYTNASGEELTITKLNYFISNIKLQKTDGSEYVIPQNDSYFLIKLAEKNTQQLSLNNIPLGEYTGLSFMIGVDSLRNTLEPSQRTGALDVGGAAEGMYWSWNTGYIFFKLEGSSSVVPATQNNQFKFHIGFYGGYNTPTINNLRTKSISFGTDKLKIQQGKSSLVHLKVDLAEFFKNPTTIKLSENNSVEFSLFSATVANNYTDMFSLDFVHN
ncbi:MAG: hypothetical protein MUC49_16360 [Raineya sp.]|nr:hypothetical protein [Raineya sp.]